MPAPHQTRHGIEPAFLDAADRFVQLANELNANYPRDFVRAALMYAAARYTAFTWLSREDAPDLTLVHAAALFALMQAPKSDARPVAGPKALTQSAADRIRAITEAGGRVALRTADLTDEELNAIMKPHRGCARCDAVLDDGWSFCPFCGERLLIS